MPTKTFYRLRDEKQEAIMRSAIHEFTKSGFSRAKVEDIAKNAEVSKASLFQYFEDKKEMFVYSAKWGLDVLMKKIDKQVNIGDMDVFEYFENSSSFSGILTEESELVRFMGVVMNEPGLIEESERSMYELGNVYIMQLIQNGKKKGSIRTDIPDEFLLEFFTGVTDRFSKRIVRLYTDMSTGAVLHEDALIKERGCMINLLRKGMGY